MAHSILIVDDEPVLADTLAIIFRRAGYHATAVYSCEDAIPFIHANQPLFVVSDVVMPGMNGVALAKLIRGSYPGCGVLLFSGNADTHDLLETARAEGHDFEVLAKPVSPPKMLEKVASLISTASN
jgi:DNA-binding NtrC family response regulator